MHTGIELCQNSQLVTCTDSNPHHGTWFTSVSSGPSISPPIGHRLHSGAPKQLLHPYPGFHIFGAIGPKPALHFFNLHGLKVFSLYAAVPLKKYLWLGLFVCLFQFTFGNKRGISTSPFILSLTKINYKIAQSLPNIWAEVILLLSNGWEQARVQVWSHTKWPLTQQNHLYLPKT